MSTITTMTTNSLPFIVIASSNGHKVPKEARTTIRKQAMKDVGIARRKRATNGRSNKKQTPAASDDATSSIRSAVSSSVSNSVNSSRSIRASPKLTTNDWLNFNEGVPRMSSEPESLLFSTRGRSYHLLKPSLDVHPEYSHARSKFGIDIMSLSILTNFNVGKSTLAIISADPTRLASLLDLPQWSFLEYVPQLYGVSECLTAATDCLLAKVHLVLALPDQDRYEACSRLYGKALQSLQAALRNDSTAMDADVLCATQLLSLHEILDPSRDTAWSHHVQGSARLVRHRSASRFVTEFERALFAAHVGGVVSECLLDGTHCYLEQQQWKNLYSSIAVETVFLTERSPLCIQLRLAMFSTPGLWHDVDQAVNSNTLFEDSLTSHRLEQRCRKAHEELLAWLEQYKAHCDLLSTTELPASELALRRELFGTALESLVSVKRLLATVCDAQRRTLEVETQALVHLMLDLQKQPSPKYSWMFSSHEIGVAYTVLLTKGQWEENLSECEPELARAAAKKRFNTWSSTIRTTS